MAEYKVLKQMSLNENRIYTVDEKVEIDDKDLATELVKRGTVEAVKAEKAETKGDEKKK